MWCLLTPWLVTILRGCLAELKLWDLSRIFGLMRVSLKDETWMENWAVIGPRRLKSPTIDLASSGQNLSAATALSHLLEPSCSIILLHSGQRHDYSSTRLALRPLCVAMLVSPTSPLLLEVWPIAAGNNSIVAWGHRVQLLRKIKKRRRWTWLATYSRPSSTCAIWRRSASSSQPCPACVPLNVNHLMAYSQS